MPWRTPPPACALPRPAGTRWPRNASPRGSTGGSTSASRSITTPKPRASLLRRNARLPGAGSLPNCASRGGLPNELAARLPGRAQATRGVLRPPSRAEPRRAGQDARRAGPRVARPAARPDGPRRHPPRPGPAPRPARRHDRAGRQRPPARAGRPQPGLHLADRPRLPRHDHPAGHPAQRAGGPRLVHRLHAYQPEIAQGRLEALLNFQTMVADLTGMELANASLLDEGSAAAEAMAMSRRLAGRERDGQREGGAFFVDADCHPQTIAVLLARAGPLGVPVVVGDPQADLDPDARPVLGVLLQYPGSGGAVRDLRPVIERAHAAGALATVAADLLALVLLAPPGKLGADVVVGSSQRFGVPMWFGGPHAAYMATREAYARSLPGGWSGCPPTRRGGPPCGWRCRPASSTSAASG